MEGSRSRDRCGRRAGSRASRLNDHLGGRLMHLCAGEASCGRKAAGDAQQKNDGLMCVTPHKSKMSESHQYGNKPNQPRRERRDAAKVQGHIVRAIFGPIKTRTSAGSLALKLAAKEMPPLTKGRRMSMTLEPTWSDVPYLAST